MSGGEGDRGDVEKEGNDSVTLPNLVPEDTSEWVGLGEDKEERVETRGV